MGIGVGIDVGLGDAVLADSEGAIVGEAVLSDADGAIVGDAVLADAEGAIVGESVPSDPFMAQSYHSVMLPLCTICISSETNISITSSCGRLYHQSPP